MSTFTQEAFVYLTIVKVTNTEQILVEKNKAQNTIHAKAQQIHLPNKNIRLNSITTSVGYVLTKGECKGAIESSTLIPEECKYRVSLFLLMDDMFFFKSA